MGKLYGVSAFFEIDGLPATLKKLDEVAKGFPLAKRRQVLRRAAQSIRGRAISLAPRSNRVHYRYSTPKLVKGRRAKRGTAKAYRIAYLPGNLKKSLQVLTFAKDRSGVFIGPKFARGNKLKEYGRTISTSDGYYAQMVFGSASAFGNRVTRLAAQSVQRQTIAIIEDGIKRLLNDVKKKTRL